jgi:Na+-driven multidrug efflux pump
VSSPNATEPDEDGQQMLHTLHKSADITESIEVHGAASERTETLRTTKTRRPWKGFNELDKEIFKAALPLSAIFAIMPVAMSTNLFWVNRLGSTLAVAGQSAANQMFASSFWLVSFLPSITATMVSKSFASGDMEATQDAVCQALLFAILISLAGTLLMFLNPAKFLSSILKGKNRKLGRGFNGIRIHDN